MAQLLRRLSGRGPSAALHHIAQPSDIPDALPGYQLVHATVYFRHGSRAPVHTELPGAQDVAWEDCCHESRARIAACAHTRCSPPRPTGVQYPTSAHSHSHEIGTTAGASTGVAAWRRR